MDAAQVLEGTVVYASKGYAFPETTLNLDWLADWRHIDFAELKKRGVHFRVILPVPVWSLAKFVKSEAFKEEQRSMLFCDPTSELFKACECNFKFDSRAKFESIHAQTTVLGATLKGFALGVSGGGFQGDARQQGAAFVLKATHNNTAEGFGTVTYETQWAHKDRHNADQVPIPVLLAAAGLPLELYKHPRAEGPVKT